MLLYCNTISNYSIAVQQKNYLFFYPFIKLYNNVEWKIKRVGEKYLV